ncbi:MAG TPA: tetratricopeptide repeat protein [Candidatus Angelobacter sp.]|jgi:tetratricopeptide (TPR) repeat protein
MKTSRLYLISLLFMLVCGAASVCGAQSQQTASAAIPGNAEDSIRTYRAVLQQEPQNLSALQSLAGVLESSGRWREAIPVLEQIITLRPQDADALYRLGSMKSWQPGGREEALDLLHRACEIDGRQPDYCAAYAEVLSWNQNDRSAAIVRLSENVKAHPEAIASRLKLAQILSWNVSTRAESLAIYDQGLRLDPGNVDLLIGSAEVLSWNKMTWVEAIGLYDRALRADHAQVRALNGKAQLLAWQGHTAEALDLYRQALTMDPNNVTALRGQAEVLNWRGQYVAARSLARQACASGEKDPQSTLELARADIGLRMFGEARTALSGIDGSPTPGYAEARQELHRNLGTFMEFGFSARRENDLSFYRPEISISSKLGLENRITFSYQPTLYDADGAGFNTNHFQARLDSEPNDKFTSRVQVGATTFNNAPVNVDGGFDLRYKPVSSTVMKFGFNRTPVEESLLSVRGIDTDLFRGQVFANLANLGVAYYNSDHRYDLSLDYTDGVNTGRNLDDNRRYTVEGQLGKAFHSDQPYIRLAYGVNYTSFDHDADIQSGVPLSRTTGGYFSPQRFLLNQGVLNLSHRFTPRFRWEATGTAGAQNVETSTASFTNTQFASSFETHVFWRISPNNELTVGYDYLNVFNAFQRNLYRVSWRHYF